MEQFLGEFTSEAVPGVLDVRWCPDLTELYLDTQPLALQWSTEEGTTIDRLIRLGYPDGDKRLAEFRDALRSCTAPEEVIPALAPFLAAGRYRLALTDEYYWGATCLPIAPTAVEAAISFYGGGYTLITTRPGDELRRTRVQRYRNAIAAGQRPWVVALCGYTQYEEESTTTTAFVLDGHHKLRAYLECQIHPHVLLVARLDSPPLRQHFPAEYLPWRDLTKHQQPDC